jgi:hypothetical protein
MRLDRLLQGRLILGRTQIVGQRHHRIVAGLAGVLGDDVLLDRPGRFGGIGAANLKQMVDQVGVAAVLRDQILERGGTLGRALGAGVAGLLDLPIDILRRDRARLGRRGPLFELPRLLPRPLQLRFQHRESIRRSRPADDLGFRGIEGHLGGRRRRPGVLDHLSEGLDSGAGGLQLQVVAPSRHPELSIA